MIVDSLLLAAFASSLYSMVTGDISGVMVGLFLIYAAFNQITFE
jgi:hypothetical protein